MLKTLTRTGYKFFGRFVHKNRHRFQQLADHLRMARIPCTVEEYVAGTAFLSISVFTILFVLSTGALCFLFKDSIFNAVISSLIVSLAAAGVTWAGMMAYPKYIAKNRGEEINTRLAFAVTHMATLSGTGISPVFVFRALTKFRDYGEISRECAFIVRDVEVFGKDLYTAIMDAARYSPSKRWAEILWGIVSTLRSGGDLHRYLSEKARQLVEQYEREEKKAMETLNILTEVFMIVFVVAPVMGVMIVVFMSMLGGAIFGGDSKLFLMIFIYFILPVIGVGFLIVGEMSKPKEVL